MEIGESAFEAICRRGPPGALSLQGQSFQGLQAEPLQPLLERHLESLSHAPIESIRRARAAVTAILHLYLQKHFSATGGGLLLEDRNIPGLLCDALASSNGSSSYLRGALIDFGENRERGAESLPEFARRNRLPGTVFVKSFHVHDRPLLLVQADETDLLALPACSTASAEARQSFNTLASVAALGQWVANTRGEHTLVNHMLRALNGEASLAQGVLHTEIEQVTAHNSASGKVIAPLLREWFKGRLSVGESFTFGKVTALLQHAAGNQPVEIFYGWYAPEFKQAVGVPAENLGADEIAEPATVVHGARGILRRLAGESTLAIGTTGYASRQSGDADFFSIAAVSHLAGAEQVKSLRFTVDATRALPASPEKRELTRQLGVTAALYLLACRAKELKLDKGDLSSLESQTLLTTLQRFGHMEF